MEVLVNGEPKTISEGATILGLLKELDLEPARLAVELDRRIVKQALWSDTVLHAGAQLEIVQFVGGG